MKNKPKKWKKFKLSWEKDKRVLTAATPPPRITYLNDFSAIETDSMDFADSISVLGVNSREFSMGISKYIGVEADQGWIGSLMEKITRGTVLAV